ncbi:MAG: hypothetical protein PHI13_14060 [Methylococcales bacterium]|nr:hypothetical protein [Methylococcales bacterium]
MKLYIVKFFTTFWLVLGLCGSAGLASAATGNPALNTDVIFDTATLSSKNYFIPQDVRVCPDRDDGYLAILKGPPFAPNNIDLFNPSVYPNGTPMQPAAAPPKPVTDQELQRQIAKTLLNRFSIMYNGNPTDKAKEGLAFFNDPIVKSIIPDSRLRAGYAMLLGTPLEGSWDAIRNGIYPSVYFGTPPNPRAIAMVLSTLEIVVNEKYQYEDPRLLSPWLGHETLHQDIADYLKEELVATGLTTLTQLQFLKEDPKLATQGTELARRNNTYDMALLNSRDANGNIHIFDNQRGLPIFPNSIDPSTYYGQGWVDEGLGPDTPGNNVLDHAIAVLEHSQMEPPLNFDDSTLQRLDADTNQVFIARSWLRFATDLQLILQKPWDHQCIRRNP